MYREFLFGATCVGILMAAGLVPTPTASKLSDTVSDLSFEEIGLPEAPAVMAEIAGFIEQLPEVGKTIDERLFRNEPIAAPEAPEAPVVVVSEASPGQKLVESTVNFELDDVQLDEIAKKQLEDFASYLKENRDVRIGVFGHTDLTGPESYNASLGQARADQVVEFLQELGVSADRVEVVKSHGEALPMIKTDAPSRENRRVKIETM